MPRAPRACDPSPASGSAAAPDPLPDRTVRCDRKNNATPPKKPNDMCKSKCDARDKAVPDRYAIDLYLALF